MQCIGDGSSSGHSKPWRWLLNGDEGWQDDGEAVQRCNLDEEISATESWFHLLRYATRWPLSNLIRARLPGDTSSSEGDLRMVDSSIGLDRALSELQIDIPKSDRRRLGELLDASSSDFLTKSTLPHLRRSCKKLLRGLEESVLA